MVIMYCSKLFWVRKGCRQDCVCRLYTIHREESLLPGHSEQYYQATHDTLLYLLVVYVLQIMNGKTRNDKGHEGLSHGSVGVVRKHPTPSGRIGGGLVAAQDARRAREYHSFHSLLKRSDVSELFLNVYHMYRYRDGIVWKRRIRCGEALVWLKLDADI